ncbi:MAG: class I SAM-dependent methyltransferase [Longimicrobiales bacterium]
MARIQPFQEHLEAYEDWFVKNRLAYRAELAAVRRHLPEKGRGLEIGVGTGLFAGPLGIRYGVEPSSRMRAVARSRNIQVVDGVAEALPFHDQTFDFTLMVTTICFLDDAEKGLGEARRVVRPGGRVITGFVDRESPLGRLYLEHQEESRFYRRASFYSTREILALMEKVGLADFRATQTIFKPLADITEEEVVKEGTGQGSFVVLSGEA